jgi:hypothetical protein
LRAARATLNWDVESTRLVELYDSVESSV